MVYNIIPIRGDGNCLFRCISYFIYNIQDRHREIRLLAVDNIIKDWDFYKEFVHMPTIQNVESYRSLMSIDAVFAGTLELTCISHLFPHYLFRVHYTNNLNTVDFGNGNIICNLLFSGPPEEGHFDVLQIQNPLFFPKPNIQTHTIRSQTRKKITGEIRCCMVKKCKRRNKNFLLQPRNEHKRKNEVQTEKENGETRINKRRRIDGERRKRKEDLLLQKQTIAQVYEDLFYNDDIESHYSGAMNTICNFCKSKNFVDECPQDKKFTSCCRKGKIKLLKSTDENGQFLSYPVFLMNLLNNPDHPDYRNF